MTLSFLRGHSWWHSRFLNKVSLKKLSPITPLHFKYYQTQVFRAFLKFPSMYVGSSVYSPKTVTVTVDFLFITKTFTAVITVWVLWGRGGVVVAKMVRPLQLPRLLFPVPTLELVVQNSICLLVYLSPDPPNHPNLPTVGVTCPTLSLLTPSPLPQKYYK